MLLCASTGPVVGRCWQHRTSTGPVLATNGVFTGSTSLSRRTSNICILYVINIADADALILSKFKFV